MSYTPNMEDIIEPVIVEIMGELEETGLFALIDGGEEVYKGTGSRAMVIPSNDKITSVGMAKLLHTFLVYVIIFNTEPNKTPSQLRKEMAPVYDKLMEDIRKNDTCWVCLPKEWNPGFLSWGGQVYVGIQSVWEVRKFQNYVTV